MAKQAKRASFFKGSSKLFNSFKEMLRSKTQAVSPEKAAEPAANEPIGSDIPNPIPVKEMEKTPVEIARVEELEGEALRERRRQYYSERHVDREESIITPEKRLEMVNEFIDHGHENPKGHNFVEVDKALMAAEFPDVPVEIRERHTRVPQDQLEEFYGVLEAMQREYANKAQQERVGKPQEKVAEKVELSPEEQKQATTKILSEVKEKNPELFEGANYSPEGSTYGEEVTSADVNKAIEAGIDDLSMQDRENVDKSLEAIDSKLSKKDTQKLDEVGAFKVEREPVTNAHLENVVQDIRATRSEDVVTQEDLPEMGSRLPTGKLTFEDEKSTSAKDVLAPKAEEEVAQGYARSFDTHVSTEPEAVEEDKISPSLTEEEELALYEDIGQEISDRLPEIEVEEVKPEHDLKNKGAKPKKKEDSGLDMDNFRKLQDKPEQGKEPEEDELER